ncbi:Kinesin-like protein kif21b [Mortierella polycephala]|uniref:Kinesin-like protein kif21b n=1 Tax=Mortierella polycephala TaxID=41804 RepID=A0A9P6Q1Z4_9FUNG|nr:Kinesin-like protein kif21b [Mortierella polycephala]
MNTAVKVALRVRPLTLQEQISNCSECISYVPNEPQIGIVGSDKSFTFDHVFDEETAQRQVYEECAKELVDRFIEGFNVTILAYGAAYSIFSLLDAQMEKDPAMEYQVFVSFLELYNEELIDLLQTQPRTRKDTIQVREDGFGGISWQGVKEQQVASASELLEWLQKGSLCRTTAATDMNQTSSRSHAIFSVILKQQRSEEPEPAVEVNENEESGSPAAAPAATTKAHPLKKLASKFHFVDLAGSERLKRTRAVGDRAKEGISINSGLLALGNVISALGDESRRSSHVPYRDSKLTRLLQDSLGGNSATLMLACVSGADADINETISTLVYANRARNIRNRVVINQDFRDATNSEVAQLRAEINRLKMENGSFRAMGSGPAKELDQRRAAEEMRSLRGEVTRLRERLRESSSELCDVLAERDTLLVEREVTGDDNIEAHPIMMTYHHNVMQLKERLIAAEDQALELQELLSRKSSSFFGRRQAGSPRQKAPSPYSKRIESTTDDDHDADGEHDRKDPSPARGRQPKRKSRQSSRAVSRFDFGATAAAIGIEPAKLPISPPIPQAEQALSTGGASSWFQNLKTEESQPLSAHLDYSSTSSGSMLQHIPTNDSDSSHSFSRRRRAARHGSGGVADTLDKAKEDIRRGLLLLKAEKNGMGMDMDLLSLLDPTTPMQARPSPASSRRRGSMTSSISSGSSRSRFQSTMPVLEDIIGGGSPMSPMRSSFPFAAPAYAPAPAPAPSNAWKEAPGPPDQNVYLEAEQKAAETLANAMKAMHRFSFPLSALDTQQISQQQQQSRLAAAIQQQKAAAIALPESDQGSTFDTSSVTGPGSLRAVPQSVISHSASHSGSHATKASEKPNYDLMLNEMQSGIAIKEELVLQLERAETDYHNMRSQYEDEIRVMEDRIREAEMDRERERAQEPKLHGSAKVQYETKIKQLMAELSDLQRKYAEVAKIANEKRNLAENQLRTLRVAVETLKAEKQRMIKRMKEDAERIKEINAANDREIQALRRAEKAALDGRKKAEREAEQQQQRVNAMLHRNSESGSNAQQAKVISFLKKPQTPKGISKVPKRAPRIGFSEKVETRQSSIPAPRPKKQGSIRLQVAQKKQVIDRAIYGYISGQHAINVMEDMLKKRERLRSEKLELEQERQRVVQAQEENAIASDDILLDFASEPQYMDDRLTMIDAEVAYINARIRALQAEAAALGFVTTIEKGNRLNEEGKDGSTTSDEEEMMTKLIRQGMADDAMGLPPGSGATVAFESSISILRSLDLNESREFLEMLFEDMVNVRGHESGLQVQVANQEKVIDELKRALQTMRQTAVGATLGYEKRCDGLEQKLRQLGGSPDGIIPVPRPQVDGSSEEDENDAEVARLNRVNFKEEDTTSPILSRDGSKDLLWTPLPDAARPRPGSAAEAVLDNKSKRVSTIFDQLYEDAMKTSEETSPKVGGSGGEFSRILMANHERRVSWAGIPPTVTGGLNNQAPPVQDRRQRLTRSSSAGTINNRTTPERTDAKERTNTSTNGHRRGMSSSASNGGAQGQGQSMHRSSASMSRLSATSHDAQLYQQQQAQQGQQLQQRGIYASTASSRQHAETIATRRSSTPISVPAIGPKSLARPRHSVGYNSNAEGPIPSPTQHHPRHGAPLTIQTGFGNDSRRTSTPSPGLVGRRLSRSDSDGAILANKTNNGNGRPLSRIGATSMMTTTQTATNMASPGLFNGQDGHNQDHYHTHHHNNSARRVSGCWDDNQNVYERLASVHTQASQARILATRTNGHPTQTAAPAGGSMMTNGNMSSTALQQHLQSQHGRGPLDRHRMHRPSVDGLMSQDVSAAAAAAAAAAGTSGEEHGAQGERNWSSNSSSSVTSASSSLTGATNSPTLPENAHEDIHESIHSLPKAEVGPVC